MNKIAFLFPGQGAQKTGMAKSFVESFKSSSDIFDEASEATGMDMKDLMFNQDESLLHITENTQPVILTASMACLMPILEAGIKPVAVAGLSLGEYTAHVMAGTFVFKDVVALAKKRGKFMQEAVPLGVGGMAAIIGLSSDEVINCCVEASSTGIVEPANFNCPGQIVIAGEIPAVQAAMDAALKKGAARAIMLQVSAPFHCSMMKPAGLALENELQAIDVHEMKIPLVTNVTAEYVTDSSTVKSLLIRQVSSPVRWEEGIRRMISDGVDTFVEIGPGKTLTGFLRKIDKGCQGYNIEDVESFEAFIGKIKS